MISEAFKSIISRNFNEEQAQELLTLALNQPTEDPAVFREDGVSFNPKPARLIDIAKRVQLSLPFESAKKLLQLSESCSYINFEPLDKYEVELQGVWLIDSVRHLHMTMLDQDTKTDLLTRAKKMCKTPDNIPAPLLEMLQHALKRYA